MNSRPVKVAKARHALRSLSVALLAGLLSLSLQAGTIVRVSTTVGDFSIELLDDIAPITVQNFLNYVERGDYDRTYIHRSLLNFVVQGGAYRFQPFVGPIDVPTDPPIQNEFNVSNTRGTVAMAKLQTDPNSATNQWFVNVKDNSGDLDSTNEGFTVFGNVLGDGMNIVDNINQLPTAPPPIGGENSRKAPFAPFISGDWSGNPQDFVYITAHVVDRFSSAVNVYEAARRLLITNVNIDDGAGRLSLTLSLIDDPEDIILEVNTDTIITVLTSPDLASTYSTSQSRLVFPQLEIHNGGGATTLCNNVVFELSDPELLRFRLVSFDPC